MLLLTEAGHRIFVHGSTGHTAGRLYTEHAMRHLLGLRSPVNTLSRLINPLGATASLQSIFHPAYARLHQEADRLLSQPRAPVFKGDSGEVEIKPQADTRTRTGERSRAGDCALGMQE